MVKSRNKKSLQQRLTGLIHQEFSDSANVPEVAEVYSYPWKFKDLRIHFQLFDKLFTFVMYMSRRLDGYIAYAKYKFLRILR